MKVERKKILLICPDDSSFFLQSDLKMIREKYDVSILTARQFPTPKKLIMILGFLWRLVTTKVDLVWMYFSPPFYAPFVVLISKLFRKKIFVITGGYDVAYVPEINWGEMKSVWKRVFQRVALSNVDLILAFSEYSKQDVLKYASPKNAKALYYGVDTERFKPNPILKKENLVVTVSFELNAITLIQKGIVTVIESARQLPEVKFIIVGRVNEDIGEIVKSATSNVSFVGRATNEELLEYFQRAKIYAQVSAHEGFGIANIEAMSSGCVPVATKITALPETIGDVGIYVPYGEVKATADAIHEALSREDLRQAARERIVKYFKIEMRKEKLLSEINSLMN